MADFYDSIVVGAGNAALSPAIAAKEVCQSVLVVEREPEYFRGGNTYLTGGSGFSAGMVLGRLAGTNGAQAAIALKD